MRTKKKYRVIELFAGVGGFRLGLEREPSKSKKSPYNIIWSNQWEPGTNIQHASDVYIKRFGHVGHSNKDIATVSIKEIPDHDILVGGFPCQDYSIARTLNQATGIIGKKGVLWWQIHRILKNKKKKPNYLILENVDRLLRSPAHQRGRDFAIMLASLSDLGYAVEWHVINAAEYGFPQRRRRVFFIGYYKTTEQYKRLDNMDAALWILKEGVLAKAFPIQEADHCKNEFDIKGSLPDISDSFGKGEQEYTFYNTGVLINRTIVTIKASPDYHGKNRTLDDVLLNDDEIADDFFVDEKDIPKWKFLKGAKSVSRLSKRTGHKYTYDEGSMAFPDARNKPARTIVTGEGGSTPSRFKHIITTKDHRFRRLMPIELERLNGFPDNFTEGASDTRRAFFMGNALVVGIVKKIGETLSKDLSIK